jgi:hypothetical protein
MEILTPVAVYFTIYAIVLLGAGAVAWVLWNVGKCAFGKAPFGECIDR